jgi:hypothetical protein
MIMTKKGIQESNFIYRKDPAGKFVAHKTRMPIIKCVCGFEILVVPDVKAMNRAIKNHAAKHNKAYSKKLTGFLTEQVLIVASTYA